MGGGFDRSCGNGSDLNEATFKKYEMTVSEGAPVAE